MNNRKGLVRCELMCATLILCTATAAMVLLADTVYVDGRIPQVAAPPPITFVDVSNVVYTAGLSREQVTNIVNGMQAYAVFGKTGITNIWSGSAAAYIVETNSTAGAIDRIVYLIEE